MQAVYYDNSDVNGDGKVDWHDADTNGDGVINASDNPWDTNGDGKMFVEGQGKVGKRSARFQALVQRTFVNTTFPHGIAVYDGGPMDSNGGGNNPKITVYNDGGYEWHGYVNGPSGTRPSSTRSAIHVTSPVIPALNQLLPDSTILQVIDMAKSLGRYYDVAGGNAQMPSDLSGICVIRVAGRRDRAAQRRHQHGPGAARGARGGRPAGHPPRAGAGARR